MYNIITKVIEIDRDLSLKDKVTLLVTNYPKSYSNLLRFNSSISWLASDILKSIPAISSDYYTWTTRCYWILHGLIDFPLCENKKCGKPIFRNVYSLKMGYCQGETDRMHCCADCARTDESTFELKRQHCMEKYGVSWHSKTETYKEKCSKTRSEHLVADPDYYEKINEKIIASKMRHFGSCWTDEMTEKSKETRYINNGTATYALVESSNGSTITVISGRYFSDEQLDMRCRTNMERYGSEYYS